MYRPDRDLSTQTGCCELHLQNTDMRGVAYFFLLKNGKITLTMIPFIKDEDVPAGEYFS